MTDGIDVREFMAGYLAESEEHLGSANANLLLLDAALKRGENHPRAVRELFRALHTMKGISAMIGAEAIVDIAHEMESALRIADQTGARLPPSAVDLFLRSVRAIEERVARLSRNEPLEPARALLAELGALRVQAPSGGSAPASTLAVPPELLARLSPGERDQLQQGVREGLRLVRVDFAPSTEKVAAGLTITTLRQRLSALGELVKVVPLSRGPDAPAGGGVVFAVLLLTRAPDGPIMEAAGSDSVTELSAAGPPPAAPIEPEELGAVPDPTRSSHVRVDVRRLDEALERLSALVVSHARLQALAEHGDRGLHAVVGEAGRRLRDLRAAIMRARMVPASELLDRAPLVVRGLGTATGKQVKVETVQSGVELDKAVVDRMFPVLVHLLRNAVDHAIESPEERRAAGKPETGTIRVVCTQSSDAFLRIDISDDGRGIDRKKVAARAGADVPDTDEQLLALLTRPGFSTLDVATPVSGRGFGMDIVQRTITELGGEVHLETKIGKGSTFSLHVPLSITIVDVLSFVCGDRTFVVPVRAVERLAESTALVSVAPPGRDTSGRARLSSDGDGALPLYDLARLIGVARDPTANAKVIIVRRGNERLGFEVDRMVGRKEVVMRPLADPLVQVAGVAGTADLGDGRPTLVLDLLALVRSRPIGEEAR